MKELEFYTKRFKQVILYCPYLYYDSKDKIYRCAEYVTKTCKDCSMCFRCRRPGLQKQISDDYFIDLSDING